MSKTKEKKGTKRVSSYPLVSVDRLSRSMISMHCSQSDDEDFKPVKMQRRNSTTGLPRVLTPQRFLTNKPLPGAVKRNESIVYEMVPIRTGMGSKRLQQLLDKYAHPQSDQVTNKKGTEAEKTPLYANENLPPPRQQQAEVKTTKTHSIKQLLAATKKPSTFEGELDTAFVKFNENVKRIYGQHNMKNQAARGIMVLRNELQKK